MKSNGGQKSNKVKGLKNRNRIQRMKLRSKKQQGQNDIGRKMAGNNSTLSVKIIKTKSLRKQKNSLKKKIIKSQVDQPKESQLKDKLNQQQSIDKKGNQNQKKNKQSTKQKNQTNKEQQRIDTQVEDIINQKINFYNAKFTILTEIGIPTINLNNDRIKQYIEKYQNEIKLNDEIVISKLIGAIGEGYIESGDEVIQNIETKENIIQKQIEQYLEECNIKLEWTDDKWKKLIKKTLIVIPYQQMPNVQMKRDLSGIEKYKILFETLSLFTQISKWSKMQMLHQFCQNFPLQTKEGIDLKELVNENELHNIRLIREYLSRIMNALNKIGQLKVQRDSREELHLIGNQLQDLSVEYYLNKMKVLQLKPVILPQFTIKQIENNILKDENREDPIQNQSQDGQQNLDNQLQQKKTIQIKVFKSKTLLEYFKPTKQQNLNDDNSQSVIESKERNEKQINQTSENKSSIQYFDVLENFFQNKLIKHIKVQDQKK
ncbi:unnamed protein product [Paramecium pentaurelia]|uniref:Uncharacterized protein n=1 Tax=Paramecium pentaurelia TaxID=43138 RepID=A0A8S1SC49_9CILI|nr:unnamed protein product [Paramecium pentaurelia]